MAAVASPSLAATVAVAVDAARSRACMAFKICDIDIGMYTRHSRFCAPHIG